MDDLRRGRPVRRAGSRFHIGSRPHTILLQHRHLVAGSSQQERSEQACRAPADDGDLHPGFPAN
jgi:hypothetical protein